MDRQTDGCREGQSDPIWHQQMRKVAKSFRLKHSTIIIMKGFDKGVSGEHRFSPKLWPPKSTAIGIGESEILYFPLPPKSLAYKPLEYTGIFNLEDLSTT